MNLGTIRPPLVANVEVVAILELELLDSTQPLLQIPVIGQWYEPGAAIVPTEEHSDHDARLRCLQVNASKGVASQRLVPLVYPERGSIAGESARSHSRCRDSSQGSTENTEEGATVHVHLRGEPYPVGCRSCLPGVLQMSTGATLANYPAIEDVHKRFVMGLGIPAEDIILINYGVRVCINIV